MLTADVARILDCACLPIRAMSAPASWETLWTDPTRPGRRVHAGHFETRPRFAGAQPLTTLAAVTFRYPGRLVVGVKRVAVVGSFNGWSHEAHPMTRTAAGDWTATIYLPPGRILYFFDVDGELWLDPRDEGRLPNAWGSEYSVKHIVVSERTRPTASRDSAMPLVQGSAPGRRHRRGGQAASA